MRVSFFGVMVLWVVTLGWIAAGSSSGSEIGGNVPDKMPAAEDKPAETQAQAEPEVPADDEQSDVTEEAAPLETETPKDEPVPTDSEEETK